jgi:hypothetical protein
MAGDLAASSQMEQSVDVCGGLSQLVHLSSELGGAADARSVTRATAPGVCSPVRVSGSASAFGLHRRRPTPYPSSCRSGPPADWQ